MRKGYLYIAQPPLFGSRRENRAVRYTDAQLAEILKVMGTMRQFSATRASVR